jgi:acyl-CoA synthetase (NDP forming)
VHPVNPGPGPYDVKVYASVEEVPAKPALAVVITNKSRNAELLDALAAKGVKRVLFGSKMSADASTLERCAALGMESAVVCPLQALGSGFHRFHGWLAGVPKV